MPTIEISGHPLETPLRFEAVTRDTFVHEDSWLLTQPQAAQLVDAWRDANTNDSHVPDLGRASVYSPLGVFVTALHMEHELSLSEWESVAGSSDTQNDLYSTGDMPFDFEIIVLL